MMSTRFASTPGSARRSSVVRDVSSSTDSRSSAAVNVVPFSWRAYSPRRASAIAASVEAVPELPTVTSGW